MDNRHNKFRFENIVQDEKASMIQKYQDLFVGERKFSALIKYEVITFLFSNLPGALGLFLRHRFYPLLFGKIGKKVVFGHHVTLRTPKKIILGDNVVIDDFAVLSMRGFGKEKIKIGNGVLIGRGSQLKARAGSIYIDDFANISSGCLIGSTSEVHIGKYCLFAGGCYVGGMQHGFDRSDVPIVHQNLNIKGGVEIGDDVWLGANVVVNDGVHIGQGTVVGAGSVVTKDIPSYKIAVGAPAKVVRSRKE
jgi:acetyltransferase-like isoleucine patch superfamily enzyme